MDAKEFHAAARRIEGLQRKLCETEVERDAWKRSYQDLSKSAHRELTEVRVTARQEIESTREEQRNVWREMLGALPQESLTEAINRVVAERDEMKEEIKQANKEASDATARQRRTEARALNYSLQADEARREIERLRAKLASRTVEWPEWAKVGARVRVRSNDCMTTQNSDRVVGEELVIANVDRRDWTIRAESFGWVHVSDLEPVAEHVAPPVVSPQVGEVVK